MSTEYVPKDGSGWDEGSSFLDGVRRWRTPVGPRLWLTVATGEKGVFLISRVDEGSRHTVARFEDMLRVELDFGVHAWSIVGVHSVPPPSTGLTLLARAVEPRRPDAN